MGMRSVGSIRANQRRLHNLIKTVSENEIGIFDGLNEKECKPDFYACWNVF